MKNSEFAETVNRKLDCLLLTARVSKTTIRDLQNASKPKIESSLSKETLAKILQIKRTEERVSERLDYWIYGDTEHGLRKNRSKSRTFSNETPENQTWGLNIHPRETPNGDEESEKPVVVGRSVSSVETKTRRKMRPWRNSEADKAESISMFHYNIKSNTDDDSISTTTTATLRTRIFSKFGTLPRKKLKMFFTKGTNDDDKKSLKNEKTDQNDNKPKDNERKGFFSKYKRKNSKKENNNVSDSDSTIPEPRVKDKDITIPRHLRGRGGRKPRPKSEAIDYDHFDFENIVVPTGNLAAANDSAPSTSSSQRGHLKERIRNMPMFYTPSRQHMV